jgi:hypothetical protein
MRRPGFMTQVAALMEDLDLAPLSKEDFERPENRALFAAWCQFQAGQDWQAWMDALPQALQLHLDFLLERGLDTQELAGEEAERDIARRMLELRRKTIDRTIQNLRMLQMEALDRGDAKASEYSQPIYALTVQRANLERALHARTATGMRQERERVV